MSAATYVDDARRKAWSIIDAETRGPGDVANAMRRVAQREGIPHAALWSLRYRPPKDVVASVYARVLAAHARMCERQRKRFADELAEARKAGDSSLLVRAALAVAGAPAEGVSDA